MNKKFPLVMSLLQNALLSIRLGIEDYQSEDSRRMISAIRNFYSGVLLLGKQCLLNVAPNVEPMQILGSKFEPELSDEGEVIYQPQGYRTIDLGELRGRFKKFGLSWPEGDVESLQKLRNNFEHYHSPETREQIQQVIAKCFPMIEEFFKHLDLDPVEELEDTWKVMLAEKNFFLAKKQKCLESFSNLSIPLRDQLEEISCPECKSALVFQLNKENSDPSSMDARCMACASDFQSASFVEELVDLQFAGEEYYSAKNGGEPIVNECPQCSAETYVFTSGFNECFHCAYSINVDCALCCEPLTIHSQSINNSHYCHHCDDRMSRDD